MTDNRMEITRRKILAGIGGVGAMGATAGLGTSAMFTDEEAFEDNKLVAGELDLKIDWQQTYDGPEDDSFPAYGSAGYPWVNAHPDEGETNDPNGIQSLDLSEYSSVSSSDVVTYEDNGANIQKYLTCETLDHNYDFGPNDSLIELEDVKPGDSGEVTFSFHLCDNPGYVWFCGELTGKSENGKNDPERASDDEQGGVVELLDEIKVTTWYDLDCDNEFEPQSNDEDVLLNTPTTLRTFFNDRLENSCQRLDPTRYPGISRTGSGISCERIGRIEFNENDLAVTDSEDKVIKTRQGNPNKDSPTGDNLEYVFNLVDSSHGINTVLRIYNMRDYNGNFLNDPNNDDLSNVAEFDWEIVPDDQSVDGFSSDNVGYCQVDYKALDTNEETASLVAVGNCIEGQTKFNTPMGADEGFDYVTWYYCAPGSSKPRCFPEEQTFCVGFSWELPRSVGNQVQSDSVSFDLGFYTEQCRNNDNPGQTL